MEQIDFIKNFAAQFDETEESVFNMETNFRELEEWSSLNALAVMNMVSKKYKVNLTPEEMRATNIVRELFELVESKQS